jgi:hypothetical protein
MKLDEKIKNKFLLSKNFNLFKIIYFLNQKIRSFKKIKKSYSSNSIEGFELNVLKGFDLKRYKPKALSIEFIDTEMRKEEFYHQNIYNIINSKLYK